MVTMLMSPRVLESDDLYTHTIIKRRVGRVFVRDAAQQPAVGQPFVAKQQLPRVVMFPLGLRRTAEHEMRVGISGCVLRAAGWGRCPLVVAHGSIAKPAAALS